MTEKQYTYLNASRNKYIGSFFCKGLPLTNPEVVDLLNENEQLKQDLSEYCNFSLHDVLDKKNKEIEQLKADKQRLIDFIKKEFPKSHKHILEGFE